AEGFHGGGVVTGDPAGDLAAEPFGQVVCQRVECFLEVGALHRGNQRDDDLLGGFFVGAFCAGAAARERERGDGGQGGDGAGGAHVRSAFLSCGRWWPVLPRGTASGRSSAGCGRTGRSGWRRASWDARWCSLPPARWWRPVRQRGRGRSPRCPLPPA